MKTIGEKISDLRKNNNISQEQFAAALLVSKQTVYNWESNKSEPSLKNIEGLCRFFSVNADYFTLNGEPSAAEASAEALTKDEQEALTKEILEMVTGEIKRSGRGRLYLFVVCLSIVAFVVCAFFTVIYGFSVFSTNTDGIEYIRTNGVSNEMYVIIVIFTVIFLVLSVLFIVLYVKNKKSSKKL